MTQIGVPSAPARRVQAAAEVPTSTRRLVAKQTAPSFREAAHVVQQDIPPLEEGQVLVDMKYWGVNGGCETFRARGEHWFAGNLGQTDFPLGAEGVGIVLAVAPDVTHVSAGQPVACNSATFAEVAVVAGRLCYPISSACAEAAAMSLSGIFACGVINGVAAVQPGMNVFIPAGAGAAGSFAVQFAKLAGATVVTTVGSASKADVAEKLGADVVINRTEVPDLGAALAAACPGGFDVVMDGVGAAIQPAYLRSLKPGAQVLLTGYISEYPHVEGGAELGSTSGSRPDNAAIFWGREDVTLENGCTMTGKTWPSGEGMSACKKQAWDLYNEGKLQALVDTKEFQGLDEVTDAIEHMLTGTAIGKVVVRA